MSARRSGHLAAVVLLVLAVGCAPKITPQQALVEEAFQTCHAHGASARLQRVDPDGRFSVVGREHEAQRVHDCMVQYAKPPKPAEVTGAAPSGDSPPRRSPPPSTGARPATAAAAPPPAPGVTSAPRSEALLAGRLPGTWRGILTLPPRASGETERAGAATVHFAVAAGSLRWTLAAGAPSPGLAADGTAVVVGGELQMTGTVRATARPPSPAPARSSVTVRYVGVMVGDRLEITGVTGDRQVHVLSLKPSD
jgi:hypothetical protein